MKEETSR